MRAFLREGGGRAGAAGAEALAPCARRRTAGDKSLVLPRFSVAAAEIFAPQTAGEGRQAPARERTRRGPQTDLPARAGGRVGGWVEELGICRGGGEGGRSGGEKREEGAERGGRAGGRLSAIVAIRVGIESLESTHVCT